MPRSLSIPQPSELHQSIIALLRQKGSRLLAPREIHERLADPDVTRDEVDRALDELEREGGIIAMRGKRYSLLEFTPYHAGRIKIHPDGHGTVLGADDEPDIYIDRRDTA